MSYACTGSLRLANERPSPLFGEKLRFDGSHSLRKMVNGNTRGVQTPSGHVFPWPSILFVPHVKSMKLAVEPVT